MGVGFWEERFREHQSGYDAVQEEIIPLDRGADRAGNHSPDKHRAALAFTEFALDGSTHFFLLRETASKERATIRAGLNSAGRKQNAAHRRTVMIVTGGCMIFSCRRSNFGSEKDIVDGGGRERQWRVGVARVGVLVGRGSRTFYHFRRSCQQAQPSVCLNQ